MKNGSVNILGLDYDIILVDKLVSDESLYGEINFPNQIIRIDKNLKKDRISRTLIHEITHGIMESIGLEDINASEEKIQSISNAIYLLIINNKDLIKTL